MELNQLSPETDQQSDTVEEIETKTQVKKTISTRLGLLIILLVATIAGAGVWWYADSCTPPEAVDVSGIVEELQERRKVKNEIPSEYETMEDGVYYKGELIDGVDTNTFVVIEDQYGAGNRYAKDKNSVYYKNELINNADSKTFGFFRGVYMRDKVGFYSEGKLIGVSLNDCTSEEMNLCRIQKVIDNEIRPYCQNNNLQVSQEKVAESEGYKIYAQYCLETEQYGYIEELSFIKKGKKSKVIDRNLFFEITYKTENGKILPIVKFVDKDHDGGLDIILGWVRGQKHDTSVFWTFDEVEENFVCDSLIGCEVVDILQRG